MSKMILQIEFDLLADGKLIDKLLSHELFQSHSHNAYQILVSSFPSHGKHSHKSYNSESYERKSKNQQVRISRTFYLE